MLSLRKVSSGYGAAAVLQGIDLDISPGEIVAVVGPNGAGKTTLLMTICGNPRARSGDIRFNGEDIARLPPLELVRRGITIVPQGRGVFPRLSVRENLIMGALSPALGRAILLEEILAFFPPLSAKLGRQGETLSADERQMLALARALMSRPRLLLLDEPSLHLPPSMVRQAFDMIARVCRERNVAILIADQNAFQALKLADRAVALSNGRIVQTGTGTEVLADPRMQSVFFGGRVAAPLEARTP